MTSPLACEMCGRFFYPPKRGRGIKKKPDHHYTMCLNCRTKLDNHNARRHNTDNKNAPHPDGPSPTSGGSSIDRDPTITPDGELIVDPSIAPCEENLDD